MIFFGEIVVVVVVFSYKVEENVITHSLESIKDADTRCLLLTGRKAISC